MLNYSTHAITELLRREPMFRRAGQVQDADAIRRFIEEVRQAPKFTLPDRGSLIYDINDVPDGVQITRLPFPKTVVEVPFSTPEKMGRDVVASTKRLILAAEGVWDAGKERFTVSNDEGEPNAIRVEVACWLAGEGWMVQPVGAIVIIGDTSMPSVRDATDPHDDDKFGGAAFNIITAPTTPQWAEQLWRQMGREKFLQVVAHDVTTEIRILAEMMAVLSCRNVETQVVAPPEKLVKARARTGAEPFYDVHELVVGGSPMAPGGTGADAGEKNKVRQHLRRGHIRRLDATRKIWVNQTVVAAGSNRGVVDKTYKVVPPGT